MPIKPENRHRYPSDWKAIVEQIRVRSGDRCEGSPAHPECRRPNGWLLNKRTGAVTQDGLLAESWALADGDPVIRIVLTVGHLDHQPENCNPANLRHWCQRCHTGYDAEHHAESAYMTRRAGKAAGELF